MNISTIKQSSRLSNNEDKISERTPMILTRKWSKLNQQLGSSGSVNQTDKKGTNSQPCEHGRQTKIPAGFK